MKDLIQKDLLSIDTPSEVTYVSNCFSRYEKFLVSTPGDENTSEESDIITLILYDGPKGDWYFCEDNNHYMLKKGAFAPLDFHLININIPKGTEVPRDLWFNTEDFEIPTIKIPTIQDVLGLPTLSINEGIYDFMEDGLSEFLRCNAYDLDMDKVSEMFNPRIQFEEVLNYTTDFSKYGQVVYRIRIDGGIVGIATKSGRWLDATYIYPTDLPYLKKFMKELEDACFEDTSNSSKSLAVGDPASFLNDKIMDALYKGVQLNESH